MRLRPRYVRDRLTLWQVGVFGALLIAYICGATMLQYWQLTRQLHQAEIKDMVTVEGLLYVAPSGDLRLHDEYINSPQSRQVLDRLMEVWTADGKIAYRNGNLKGQPMGGLPFRGEGATGFDGRSLRLHDGTQVQMISHVHRIGERSFLIRLGYDTDPIMRRVRESLGILLLMLPFALMVSGVAGYRFAGNVLRPLERMARQTETIKASHLGERIPVENPEDELGHMATVLNELLQRIHESFEQLKEFTSDVSHELRTPLASMRTVGEVGLLNARSVDEYRQVIASMLEEVGRLSTMVATMLTMARAEAGQLELQREKFSLHELVEDVLGLMGVLAEEKHQKIATKYEAEAMIEADRPFLRLALVNLLDNAVKYTPEGGLIQIRIAQPQSLPAVVELSVEDSGPGVPGESRERVFDRFYRVDKDRSRQAGGAGLGLSIAKWAIEAHDGVIGFRPGAVSGSIFYFQLPLQGKRK